MLVTRKAEFSSSHCCRLPELSDEDNFLLYGAESNANGHGHNYVIEVSIEGEVDPVTGMVLDLKHVKEILEEEVIEPMDHRFLNYEVSPFDRVVPTAANIANEIWRRLEGRFSTASHRLARVRLYESDDLYVDVVRDPEREEDEASDEVAA